MLLQLSVLQEILDFKYTSIIIVKYWLKKEILYTIFKKMLAIFSFGIFSHNNSQWPIVKSNNHSVNNIHTLNFIKFDLASADLSRLYVIVL